MKSGQRNALLGATNQEQTQIKMIWSMLEDLRTLLITFNKSKEYDSEKKKKWEEEISEWLKLLLVQLGTNHYLMGASITWPDFNFYETLQWIKGMWPDEYA